MTVLNAWPGDSPDGYYEEAVRQIAESLGAYRLHRIEWLAEHGVPMDVIAQRLSLPSKVVEYVLSPPEDAA